MFEDGPATMAFLSETVHTEEEAVTYVCHDADDGAWQFLGDRMAEVDGPVLVCLQHLIEHDPSLKELADLPVGWCAEGAVPRGFGFGERSRTKIGCKSFPRCFLGDRSHSKNLDMGTRFSFAAVKIGSLAPVGTRF